MNVEQKDGNTLTVKYGKGDKVYIHLNKTLNPTTQMQRHNNTIMYVIAPMNNEWFFVSENPNNSTGYGMPVRVDEMEMRYQHVNNWSDEQWEMYKSTTIEYNGTMNMFKVGDKVTIVLPKDHAHYDRCNGWTGTIAGLVSESHNTYQIYIDNQMQSYWAYGHEMKKTKEEETPVKEQLIVNASNIHRGFSSDFLTQMGMLVSELGSAVEFFNDSEETVSQIESLEFTVNTGSSTGKPFKVHLASHPNGKTSKFAAVFEEMS